MTEAKFWELIGEVFQRPIEEIQEVGYDQLQNSLITKQLEDEGEAAIIGFHEVLCQKIRELYSPKIGDLFLMSGYNLSDELTNEFNYISEDGFVDFRAWIVSMGKQDFEIFLNFKSEEELLEYDMDANGAFREDLVYLANTICNDLGIEIDLKYPTDGDVNKLYSNMNWGSLDTKYPKLFKFYQDRFKEGYY